MKEDKKITVTNVNIRQSIAVLLARIILTDIVMAALVIFAYYTLISASSLVNYNSANTPLFLGLFVVIGFFKILINCYIILQWLNEYYEITPEFIIHKQGIIFKKIEKYRIDNIREIDINDNLIGEIFNFATITILDIRRNKDLDMFLVHNADRYVKILKQLRPNIEMKQDHTKIPLIVNGSDE